MPSNSPRKSPNTARDRQAAHAHVELQGDGTCDSSSDPRAMRVPRECMASPPPRTSLPPPSCYRTAAYVLQPISAFSPPRMLQAARRMAVPRGACVSTKHVDGACDSWGWTHYCAGVPSDNHVICAVSSLRPTSQPYTAVMLQYEVVRIAPLSHPIHAIEVSRIATITTEPPHDLLDNKHVVACGLNEGSV
jgi:hypothetical protein